MSAPPISDAPPAPARRLAALVLALLAGLAVAGRAAAGDPETERLLAVVARGEAAPGWDDAVRALKAGTADQRARVDALLESMARDRHAAWAQSAARIAALASKVGDGRAADEDRKAWEAARARANEWIFDTAKFPIPADPLITGPREGYPEAKKRGDAAVKAWDHLVPALDRALAPALGLSAERARALASARDAAAAAFHRVAAEAPEAVRAALLPPEPDPFAEHLLLLRRDDLSRFAQAYAAEPEGWRRLLLFHAWCEAVLARNEGHPFGMEPDALRGMRAVNAYRRALGISPVAHDERLVKAARGHSAEMAKMGYFSHKSPTAGRETKEKRAALEGYTARVVECITGAGGGTAAVEFWKFDGGHHRDLVDPRLVEGGFSTRGPSVYDAGAGMPGSLPVFRY